MKVKIGAKLYDSVSQPIMLILSDDDKENIRNMHPDSTKFCSFPSDMGDEQIRDWMDRIPEIKTGSITK